MSKDTKILGMGVLVILVTLTILGLMSRPSDTNPHGGVADISYSAPTHRLLKAQHAEIMKRLDECGVKR